MKICMNMMFEEKSKAIVGGVRPGTWPVTLTCGFLVLNAFDRLMVYPQISICVTLVNYVQQRN